MSKPVVASYCTTFLKPEMLHIYRQVTGLKSFETFVICKERKNEERFEFADVEMVHPARRNLLRRGWLKYVDREPPIVYRGKYLVLNEILKRREPDLMHVYFGHTGVWLLPFIEHWSRPVTVSFHGIDIMPREEKPGYLDALKRMLQVLPLVMARSVSLKERLVSLGCPEDKIRINRTGIPMDQFPIAERAFPENGRWHLIQACRLIEKKGLDLTLRAFAAFRKEYPKARLTIAGRGPLLKDLERLATELDLGDSVTFAGFLGLDDLARLYVSGHLFLHPSRLTADQNQEGIPNSMLEAMATGLPVIATHHGGIPEAVSHGKTGLLSDENNWEQLRDSLFELARDPELWQRLSHAAAQDVRDHFADHAQIAKLESYYRELL